ncbi:hypothetical protein BASA81_005359 [Batrachochytrium salamandrivorans]|nr:hypothetical protein BASA81_005359 [Batrachochytrium salamandrivorans]
MSLETVVCLVPLLLMLALLGIVYSSRSSPFTSLMTPSASNRSVPFAPPPLANFYNDSYSTYSCVRPNGSKFPHPGSAPKFMIIGSHKSGSTAMYSYLMLHGHVRPALCKEVKFFDHEQEFTKGRAYYLSNFPNLTSTPHVITGDGSPTYIYHPLVPGRVRNMLGESQAKLRFLAGFRHPSLRFFSHWVGQYFRRETNLTCRAYWDVSLSELHKCLQLRNNTLAECEIELFEHNPVVRGMYASQVERWLEVFPPHQFLLYSSEFLFANVEQTMQHVAKFLGVRPYNAIELESFHGAYLGTNHLGDTHTYPFANECDSELKSRVDQFYQPHNARLVQLLLQKFPHNSNLWLSW